MAPAASGKDANILCKCVFTGLRGKKYKGAIPFFISIKCLNL